MITLQTWQTIRHLAASGHSHRRIAKTLGVSRKTVCAALTQDTPPTYRRAPTTAARLEAYQTVVEAGLRRGLAGIRLLQQVREHGYSGSAATFYRWLVGVRASLKQSSAFARFETEPGEQAPFDGSPYELLLGSQLVRVIVYALVLGFSRRVHFFPSLSERLDAVLEGLEAGWRPFGGVCRFVVIDNAKTMALLPRRSLVRFNNAFLALCGHYRVQPIAATPAHPQSEGKSLP